MAPKSIDWPAIKKRYLLGEKPKALAETYGLTASQVSDKAKREKWKPKKARLAQKAEEKIEKDVETELDQIQSVYGSLILSYGKDLLEAKQTGLVGLTIQDGEGLPNRMAEHVIKAGLAMYLEAKKQKQESNNNNGSSLDALINILAKNPK